MPFWGKLKIHFFQKSLRVVRNFAKMENRCAFLQKRKTTLPRLFR